MLALGRGCRGLEQYVRVELVGVQCYPQSRHLERRAVLPCFPLAVAEEVHDLFRVH